MASNMRPRSNPRVAQPEKLWKNKKNMSCLSTEIPTDLERNTLRSPATFSLHAALWKCLSSCGRSSSSMKQPLKSFSTLKCKIGNDSRRSNAAWTVESKSKRQTNVLKITVFGGTTLRNTRLFGQTFLRDHRRDLQKVRGQSLIASYNRSWPKLKEKQVCFFITFICVGLKFIITCCSPTADMPDPSKFLGF